MTLRTNPAGMLLDKPAAAGGVRCGACREGWPKMTTIAVEGFREAVVVCADPRACRLRGMASGVYKNTTPSV